MNILIVDDSDSSRLLLSTILKGAGYVDPLCAGSAGEALTLLDERCQGGEAPDIDLILMDVVMPGMNGFELARAVQTLHPDLPCLFMSGYTPDDIPDPGASACPGPILQKPFSRDALANAVRQALAKSA